MDELEKKAAEINDANNKAIAGFQAELDHLKQEKASEVRLNEVKAEFEKKWDAADKEFARLKSPDTKTLDVDKDRPENKAFSHFLRKGYEALAPEERKVLTVADSTHIGVTCPPEYVAQVLHYAFVRCPIRGLATMRQTQDYEVLIPVNDAYGVATWEAESATKTETTGYTVAQRTIIPQEMKCLYKATQKALEDSFMNVEAEIAYAVGRAFGDLEGTAFYGGNGTTTGPAGLVTNTTIAAAHLDVGTDDTLVFDDFIKLKYGVKAPYSQNASWLFNRTLTAVICSLKSATTNTYLLNPALTMGQPATILGDTFYEWTDFPAIVSTTLSSIPGDDGIVAMYGDIRQAYCVVDRVDLTIQRLNELYAADGMVGFYARHRVGGGVLNTEAVKVLHNVA